VAAIVQPAIAPASQTQSVLCLILITSLFLRIEIT
jgi:hypothetical protein